MSLPPTLEGPLRDPEEPQELLVRLASADALRDEFRVHLSAGARFVPTEAPYRPRQRVGVRFVLDFCGETIVLPAEVVAVVDRALGEVGNTAAGVSVRFSDSPSVLQERLESLTGLYLVEGGSGQDRNRRWAERSHSDADVVIETAESEYAGTTANLSYTGVLALLSSGSVRPGTKVQVHLSSPEVELALAVKGRVVHSRRCDGGVTAHAIQLHYPAERIDEVMAFIEFLQSFDRARRLANVSGAIEAGGLGEVLDMFVNTAPSGTLAVFRGEDEGKIVFSEHYILRCTLGMASGMKALSRMFLWNEGRFEFHRDLQLPEAPDDPVPLETAMMLASLEMDEMARVGFDRFDKREVFRVEAPRAREHRETLTALEREVLEYVEEGFNVEAISDMLADSDADVFKALVVLFELGVLSRRSR